MSNEDWPPRKAATIPETRRRKLSSKTTSMSERIPAFPIQPLGGPSIVPARTHRTEVAKKVAPRYDTWHPDSSQLGPDFRSRDLFSSEKPWVAPRKAPSNLRGSALASGKPVQHKHALPSPVPRSIKKSSQRMTPGGARIDLRTEIVPLGRNSIDLSGASAVAGRSPSTRTQFVPLRRKTTTHNGASSVDGQFPPTRTLASSSRRDNTGGSSPPRSTLRQVRRKTVSDSGSAHVRKGTTANLSSPPPRPLGDNNDANVVYFEPDDRVTPRNLKRKLLTRPRGRPPRNIPGVGLKAARKTAAGTHIPTEDDGDIIEIDSDDTSESEWTASSDDADQLDPEEYALPSTAPPREVLEAFNKLTLHTRRMQENSSLPFLRRSFRRGFLLKCRNEGKRTTPKDDTEFSLEVIYRLDEGHLRYTVKGLGLFCPLCNLFGRFPTRETLAAHLEWDHTAVLVHWIDMTMCWRVTITLTSNTNIEEMEGLSLEDIPLEYTDYEMDEPNEAPKPSVSDEAEASAVVAPLEEVAPPPPIAPETPSVVQALDETQLSVPYVNVSSVPLLPPPTSPPAAPLIALPPSPAPSALLRSSPPQLPPPSSPATNLSDPVATHPDASAAAPPHEVKPKTPLPATIDLPEIPSPTNTQPPQAPCPPSSRPPNLPARCPTPPPKENPLGPAARYPYLPYVSEYGGPTMFYSCRPGGPRLYDLLGTLPMEPFGLMAWYILDIEEEMFDEDHIADELKVVLALWGRWIFLHRMEFLANYYQGVIMFVDEYWRMIHRAAGWNALRWHLMILKASKFLTFTDVAKVLKHYEYLVGMEYWEK
ncbi:hypothetical protein CCMSSC00406_0008094 [Pleurotus cornucopiae]|uniref:Uncharacterized protein n=1 Tax=Pleurotus cornucopiae TaxID=5321 RepID=A0ACB7IJN6_PLECO|nr:hypothetical protein CCMSSC00406_0008094 [Pleurotus cornucopiae]